MIPVLLEVWAWARGFLAQHWAKVGTAAFVLLLPFTMRQCSQLVACREAVPVATAAAGQAQAAALSASAKTLIRYFQVQGKPCPEIEVVTEASGGAAGSQAQSVSASASQGQNSSPGQAVNGVYLGGGWVFGAPAAQLGLNLGKIRVDGLVNTGLAWGVLGSYRLFDF